MANKELVDFVNNELPSDGEWWLDGSEKFHKACGTLLAHGVSIEEIKKMLTELYWAVAAEYGS